MKEERQHNNQKEKLPKDAVFFQFFMDSQKNLHAYILASIHNYADANDILQETATVMWRKFDEFDRETNFTAWGISIAKNLVKNYFNGRRRSRLQFNDELVLSIEKTTLEQLADDTGDRIAALQRCCEKLTVSNRQLLKLRYRDGLTIKSIASRLGRTIPAMYKYMARLQDALLRCVKDTLAMSEKSI